MKRFLLFALFAALLMPMSFAPAQTGPTTSTSSPDSDDAPATSPTTTPAIGEHFKPVPTAINLSETASNAESAALTLKRLQQELHNDPTEERTEADLNVFVNEIDARRREAGRLLASNPSLQTLRGLEEDWHVFAEQLDGWKRDVARSQAQLQRAQNDLKQLQANWELTADHLAKSGNVRPEAEPNIRATLKFIKEVAEEFHAKRHSMYGLNNRIDEQSARVLDMLASLQDARELAFNRLLMRDSPPVWNATTHDGNVATDSQASFLDQIRAIRAYAWRQQQRFGLHVAVFAALAIALFWTRWKVKQWKAQEIGLQRAVAVFETPIATALVLALLASKWVYPQAPRLFWAFIGAASLIPTIVVLRRLIERRLYSILNALVAFYFFDQLRSVEASQPILSRWLFLIEMAVATVFLASFLNSSRLTEQRAEGDRLTRWVRAFARLGIAIFGLAFIADVLGYVAFANLIGDAMLGSAYLAVVLYASARIVDGLLMIAFKARPVMVLGMVRRHHRLLQRRISRFLHAIFIVLWALGTLELLSLRMPTLDLLHSVLTFELAVGSFRVTLGHLIAFGLAVWASFLASRLIRFVLEEDVYERFPLPSGTPYAISRVLHYVILMVGFFIAVAALGYDMTSFTILASAFGVGLGFGMQSIVNNFVSGLILFFERPVRVGDVIQIDNIVGVVVRIGIRASIIRTEECSEIIIPNGRLISDRVENWTLSNRQRGIEIPVAVAAGTDPRRVISLLEKTAAANPLVTDSPRPHATFLKFGGDAFNFSLRAWTNRAEEWERLRSDLSVAINDALVAEKIVVK